MSTAKTYIAIGAAVFLGNVAYNQVFNDNDRISSVEHEMAEIKDEVTHLREDIGVIKDSILESRGISIKHTQREFDCLVRNIYFEAGIEDDLGKYAVAQVTLNRLSIEHWGEDICSVVYAPAQFSWTFDKKKAKIQPTDKNWERSVEIAKNVLIRGHRVKPLERSLFYHADYIKKPKWADDSKRIKQIGRHIFYTQAKGSWLKVDDVTI